MSLKTVVVVRSFTVGFCLALILAFWLRSDLATGFTLAGCLGLLGFRFLSRNQRSVLIGLCAGGLVAHATNSLQLNQQLATDSGKTDLTIVGTIVSVPKHDEKHSSFLFRVDGVHSDVEGNWPAQVRLSWYGGKRKSIAAGDQWRLVARLKPNTSLGNPGGFNFEQWLFHQRLHATGYVRDSPPPERLRRQPKHLHAVRERLAQQITALPAADEQASLVQGLTVGVTNNITTDQWQTLRLTGTAHLLAISGLHIGLVGGWAFVFASLVWKLIHVSVVQRSIAGRLRFNKPTFAWSVSCIGALIYAALAGFSLPTQRALIMLGVFVLSLFLRRIWPPGTALLFALLIVLLIDPLSVLSVGFWLSFGTVTTIFYLNNGHLRKQGKKSGMLRLHLKLGFILLPATAWFFQQGALIAPVANAIAVPVIGLVVVPVSFVIALLTPWWPGVANLLLIANQWVLGKLLWFLDWLLTLPASSLSLFLPGPFMLLCTLAALVLLFSPRGLHLRWLSIPLVVPAIVMNLLGKPVNGLHLHVLDVGQGLAAVMFTENHTVLFDTGKRISDKATMLDRVVKPFLVSNGRSNIDIAVLSHADDDHAGGIKSLQALYPDARLYSSDEEHQLNEHATACEAGHGFRLDGVTFVFLHPGGHDFGSRNNMSCVLLVHYGHTRVLLTGDIESESERLLLERVAEPLSLTALVAPHHGSRSSSTPEFVAMFPAETVIFAAGENNKFGFPHPDVVERYVTSGAATYTTGKHGALFLQFDHDGLTAPVDWFWHNRRRFRR